MGVLMLWHLKTLGTLAGSFGPKAAALIYLARQRSSNAEAVEIRLPDLADRIKLRLRSSDWSVLLQVFVQKEYEVPSKAHAEALSRFYSDTLRAGGTPIILDCGANVGLASIWYAARYPDAHIIAIEPESENYALLASNAQKWPNIHPVHAGILDRKARVSLSNTGDEAWAWETREAEDGAVQTVTVDELVAQVPNGKLFIAKIDIEGSESELFRSATGWVENTPLVVVETHDMGFPWRGTAHAVLRILAREARDYLHHGENLFAFSHRHLSPAARLVQPGRSRKEGHRVTRRKIANA